jgi:two-component system response regulator HydG
MVKRILIIDDELSICQILSNFLNRNGYDAEVAHSGMQAMQLLSGKDYDLILCDYNLGDICGIEILEQVQARFPKVIVIFISGTGDIPTAVNLVKGGAYHFLTKPLYPDLILTTIDHAFRDDKSIRAKNAGALPASPDPDYIRGTSSAANRLFEYVDLVAPTDYNVIIRGETGTGKEALAKFLHKGSQRKERPFIAIDCGSLSLELAASELFGHQKGAFTGAQQDKKGAFELADGGTLFLDEIGNLPYETQMLLLRALQEKVIRRVGEIQERKVDIRVIVASNNNLQELVHQKKFREDLYHRLNEFTLDVPPLRERMSDLPLFVGAFTRQVARHLGKKVADIAPEVWDLFYGYSWPGNIRELQNVIKRACLLTPEDEFISEGSLPLEITANLCGIGKIPGDLSANSYKEDLVEDFRLKNVILEAERNKILSVLEEVNYNKTKAAALLDIDRKTLYNKLKVINEEFK